MRDEGWGLNLWSFVECSVCGCVLNSHFTLILLLLLLGETGWIENILAAAFFSIWLGWIMYYIHNNIYHRWSDNDTFWFLLHRKGWYPLIYMPITFKKCITYNEQMVHSSWLAWHLKIDCSAMSTLQFNYYIIDWHSDLESMICNYSHADKMRKII